MSDSFGTPWTVAHQAPLSMNFPGKNTGVGCLSLGDLPDRGMELVTPAMSPALHVGSLLLSYQENPIF